MHRLHLVKQKLCVCIKACINTVCLTLNRPTCSTVWLRPWRYKHTVWLKPRAEHNNRRSKKKDGKAHLYSFLYLGVHSIHCSFYNPITIQVPSIFPLLRSQGILYHLWQPSATLLLTCPELFSFKNIVVPSSIIFWKEVEQYVKGIESLISAKLKAQR